MTRILGIIPARYASSRFPGKPLVMINGKTMIQRVYEQCSRSKSLSAVVVATDDSRISDAVKAFGGAVIMTDPNHQSGTDRCFEALAKSDGSYDYAINIQGDEPVISPKQIDLLAGLLNGKTEIATLVKRLKDESELFDPNVVKVVFSKNHRALLFSRSTIPHMRNVPENDWLTKGQFFKHIGIYAYRSDILKEITELNQSKLELAESLEQLRWLEHGYSIKIAETQYESIGIDTPADLEKLKGLL